MPMGMLKEGREKPQLVLDTKKEEAGNPFPIAGILPKHEIQALDLLSRHGPECDGRGVVVAIFDTGIDPGAPGLGKTTDGKPKLVDVIDCTGSGDVSLEKEVAVGEIGQLKGLSGRTLVLPNDLRNPSGKVRLGIKRAYDFFPSVAVRRLKEERRKRWEEKQRSLGRELYEKDDEEPRKTWSAMCKGYQDLGPVFDIVAFHDGEHWRAIVDTSQTGDLTGCPQLADFKVEQQFATFSADEMLNFSAKFYSDGKVVSIVVAAGRHGTHVAGITAAYFPDQPEMNGVAPGCQIISCKIGDSRLGSMETGVGLVRALIATANAKADLVNMSYGEFTSVPSQGRVSELITELVEKHNIVFVSSAGNSGPCLTTAGAPGATTESVIGVGASVTYCMMKAEYGIRDPSAGESADAFPAKEMQYTWSSRGPAADGALGVSVTACGGAMASVPNFCFSKSAMLNGTSMSSPAACGAFALLMSTLRHRGISWTPHSLRRAVETTCRRVSGIETFAQGNGMVQVGSCVDYFLQHRSTPSPVLDVNYQVRVSNQDQLAAPVTNGRSARGIYLRESFQRASARQFIVSCKPKFHEDEPNQTQLDFELRMGLVVEAETTFASIVDPGQLETGRHKAYLTCPEHLHLVSLGSSFKVEVDPTALAGKPGAHYAEVKAYRYVSQDDSNGESTSGGALDMASGPIFSLPVTTIIPHFTARDIEDSNGHVPLGRIAFHPGRILRRFFDVPSTATWCNIIIRPVGLEGKRNVWVHTNSVSSSGPLTKQTRTSVEPGNPCVISAPVAASRCMELAVAQFWNSLGTGDMDISVEFHSLLPSHEAETENFSKTAAFRPAGLVLHASQALSETESGRGEAGLTAPLGNCSRVRVTAGLRSETCVRPSGSISVAWVPLRPKGVPEVRPLQPDRDCLWDGAQIYEQVLQYEFSLKSATKVRPVCPTLNALLYESPLEGCFYHIFDENKRRVASGDAWPDAHDLMAGRFLLKLQLRHDSPTVLMALSGMSVYAECKLGKPVSIPIYSVQPFSVFRQSSPQRQMSPVSKDITVEKGQSYQFFASLPSSFFSNKQIKPFAKAGAIFRGEIYYGADKRSSTIGSMRRPNGWPLSVFVDVEAPASGAKKQKCPPSKEEKGNNDTTQQSGSENKCDEEKGEKPDKVAGDKEGAAGKKENASGKATDEGKSEAKVAELAKKVANSKRDCLLYWFDSLDNDSKEQAMDVLSSLRSDEEDHIPLLARFVAFQAAKRDSLWKKYFDLLCPEEELFGGARGIGRSPPTPESIREFLQSVRDTVSACNDLCQKVSLPDLVARIKLAAIEKAWDTETKKTTGSDSSDSSQSAGDDGDKDEGNSSAKDMAHVETAMVEAGRSWMLVCLLLDSSALSESESLDCRGKFKVALQDLKKFKSVSDFGDSGKLLVLQLFHLSQEDHVLGALKLINSAAIDKTPSKDPPAASSVRSWRINLLSRLGSSWDHWKSHCEDEKAICFPAGFDCF